MKPLLSIIIPFFGNADPSLLERCMASIRNQQIPENQYEIILATDDGGRGVYAARNTGMRKATGCYLLFVDADDWLYPGTLAPCLELLQCEQPDMLTFDYRKTDATSADVPAQPTPQVVSYPSGAAYMASHNFLGVIWRYFIRRELVETEHLQFVERRHHQDEIFCAECYFIARTLLHTNQIVYAYCQHQESLVHHASETFRERRMSDFRNILTELRHFSTARPDSSLLQKTAIERRLSFLTIAYLLELRRNHCPWPRFLNEIRRLRQEHFLPLPARNYNWKYRLARTIINPFSRFLS